MYECIYNEQEQTIVIKLSRKGRMIGYISILFMLAVGIVFIFNGAVVAIILASIVIASAVVCFVLFVATAKNDCFRLSNEGICAVGLKSSQFLRWDECGFIGMYKRASSRTVTGLVVSKHTPKRNEEGKIPREYPWPKEETIDLTDIWYLLSWEDKQRILEFCGGMRG